MDSRLIKTESSISIARASVAQHETKLNTMEKKIAESKRIRILACSICFIPLTGVDPQLALQLGMSEAD